MASYAAPLAQPEWDEEWSRSHPPSPRLQRDKSPAATVYRSRHGRLYRFFADDLPLSDYGMAGKTAGQERLMMWG